MTLPLTLDEVRAGETSHYGPVTWPVPWWPPGQKSSYCVGWQTVKLGLRTGTESVTWLNTHPHMISIAAFRAHYQWDEIHPSGLRPGDLIISNWTGATVDGELEAEHMEWAYSTGDSSLVIVGANTGPEAGVADPNGIWKKTRPLDSHILFGIRPPYKTARPSLARKHEVKVVAGYVNGQQLGNIPTSTAAGPGKDTGIEGPNYWRRVQTWGRKHGYYGSHFVIDGIPGPQSRICETAAYKTATLKK